MIFSKLYIDQNVINLTETENVCRRLNVETEIVTSINDVYKTITSADDPIHLGKKVLLLTRNKGAFLKSCPGTRHYTCCDYKILHIGSFCTMDCSYCILQAYFHPPVLQLFVNQGDLWQELDDLFALKQRCRIGTGEFTDSLIWNRWSDLNIELIQRFGRQHHAVLELKTKTDDIADFKGLPHNQKTILAWSLNTETIIKSEERRTASLTARLKAAAQCQAWGYPLAFHFDPVFLYDGCEMEYREVVSRLFSYVSPDRVAWISIGTFRFIPDLKAIIQKRFPRSKIVYGEFITGLDNKMRYFKPLRIKIYQELVSAIQSLAPQVTIYFCMEDDPVWRKAFGKIPATMGGLPHLLDHSVAQHCGLE